MNWQGKQLTIEPATEVGDVLAVLDETAGWLRRSGVAQWPDHFKAAWVEDAITHGETWLARLDGTLAGTLTLDWDDPLWTDKAARAGYVHRLAVRRPAAGLGRVLLDWAADATRSRQHDYLRLDCVSSNQKLRAYYEARGFHHHDDVPVGGAPGQRETEGPITWVSRYELALNL